MDDGFWFLNLEKVARKGCSLVHAQALRFHRCLCLFCCIYCVVNHRVGNWKTAIIPAMRWRVAKVKKYSKTLIGLKS